MRVALVSPYDMDVPGGVQSHVKNLADALAAIGDDVGIVAPGRRSRGRLQTVGSSLRIPFNDSVAPIALGPGAARRTTRALRAFAPDVVHVHEPGVPWVGLAAAGFGGAPVVATFHAWSDRDRAYRAARPLLRRATAGLSATLAVSTAAADYHAAALGVARNRFEIVPNGVDVDRFAGAQPFPSFAGEDSILFVGRLEPRKGLDRLIRAFTILKTTRPTLRLYVVGDGPDRDRCQELLPARLRTDVVFLGRVDNDELPRFYRSSRLFVSPALGGESFGIVLLEAMAAGIPVIASNIPGYRSVVSDGIDARLVPPGDARALAAAIEALLDHPASAAALVEEGRRTVRGYDWPAVARRARAVYERVVRTGADRG